MNAELEEKKAATSSKLVSLFKLCDLNGDGYLDRSEFEAIMKALRSIAPNSFDDGHASAVLSAFDNKADGLINYAEFVQWVMADGVDRKQSPSASSRPVCSKHVFLRPVDEARMERETLFELRKDENAKILQQLGYGRLEDPSLLIVSMGSSSTQVYDAQGLTLSIPIGTGVVCESAVEELRKALPASGSGHSRVLLINSIGYSLSEKDPCLVDLQAVIERLSEKASDSKAETTRTSAEMLLTTLRGAMPKATIQVHNRAKDSATKRSKYPQLTNDFSEALACGRSLDHQVPYDAVVDWGGKSYKVYSGGKRVATELMDANTLLCAGGQVDRVQLQEAIRDIETFVLSHLPSAKNILIAQTGKTRELALKEELNGS